MLTDDLFACPVCALPLRRGEGALTCESGHGFDVAREGYVNLLLAQHRRSRDPGYSKQMIRHRREFFADGHYEPLADALGRLVLENLGRGDGVVLDAGCGEGYYLRRLRTLAGGDVAPTRIGVDVSKHGIRSAAQRDDGGVYATSHGTPSARTPRSRRLRGGGYVTR